MSLPTPNSPTFELKLHSVNTPVVFKPFTVKDEKIFLIAEEGNDVKDILRAIRQVVTNCCLSDVNINKLPSFDLEYFFLQLRSKSVSNISVVKYRDKEDNVVRDFEIDLDKIDLTINPNHKNVIKLTDTMTVTLKYPTIEAIESIDTLGLNNMDTAIETVAVCLDMIMDGDTVYDVSNYSKETVLEFVNSLSTQQFENIVKNFIDTMPKLFYNISYVNNLGNKREIHLEGFRSFFQ
jgi:hypothetical protein